MNRNLKKKEKKKRKEIDLNRVSNRDRRE
jgi:hypothetical protein